MIPKPYMKFNNFQQLEERLYDAATSNPVTTFVYALTPGTATSMTRVQGRRNLFKPTKNLYVASAVTDILKTASIAFYYYIIT